MALNELYQARILEHNRAPHNHFELPDATHSARGLDALCGDDIHVWLKIRDGVVEQASWSGEACVITTASASMLSDWIIGRRLDQVCKGRDRFVELLENSELESVAELGALNALKPVGRFPSRKRNALLPWETAIQAIRHNVRPE